MHSFSKTTHSLPTALSTLGICTPHVLTTNMLFICPVVKVRKMEKSVSYTDKHMNEKSMSGKNDPKINVKVNKC